MHVTVQHLQTTGIGRTVNFLRKDDGEVGMAAKALISKWKEMVANENSEGSEEEKPQENDYSYEDDESNTMQTESMSNNDRKTHKSHEHKSSSSNNSHHNHHHNHHREHHHQEQHHHHHSRDQHRLPEKLVEIHTHQRKVHKIKILERHTRQSGVLLPFLSLIGYNR